MFPQVKRWTVWWRRHISVCLCFKASFPVPPLLREGETYIKDRSQLFGPQQNKSVSLFPGALSAVAMRDISARRLRLTDGGQIECVNTHSLVNLVSVWAHRGHYMQHAGQHTCLDYSFSSVPAAGQREEPWRL